ncbi:MAG TPA: hypothetical protein VLL27_12115 [Solirubrobacterales bacterium]|nr:hypothetical protein [Solirubrobacterales bacterium]
MWRGLGLIVALALAVLVLPSAAAASPLVPPGFVLQGSHGYKVFGLFFDGTPHEEPDELILIVGRKGAGLLYAAPAEVDETSVAADLGALGSVDLHFVPTGRPKSEATPCGRPKRLKVEGGRFEGVFDFRGEEDYTRAHAKKVRATPRIAIELVCGATDTSEGFGGHSPGARLTIHRRTAGETTELVVRKNSPTCPARFEAWIEETVGRILVTRDVTFTAAPSAFQFSVPSKAALVVPGGRPFHGSAMYDGRRGKFSRAQGSLTVDFPGHSGVHLLGSHTSAGMVRYVDNPSHPFDLPGVSPFSLPRLGAWLSTRP